LMENMQSADAAQDRQCRISVLVLIESVDHNDAR